ncbi:hypothetical protein AMATHDRAFT_8405 [Amanita thiersii Skay4041]|uniref:Uncharacterized protein n=1 Tax=Amanita thiersii Skay4041 TaxID=703135 RepID=A0A2A9NCK5_9AGAR|nr:hypothetical protein AMATHDRAFT_8405 [Amanita thiersii Skay4041]
MSSSSASIQLPDLSSPIRPFQLRTNSACRTTTLASHSHFLTPNTNTPLTPTELTLLPTSKFALLASLCFPTCDPPQLLLLTNFLTLLTFAHLRFLNATTPEQCGWSTSSSSSESSTSGIDILAEHELFKNISADLSRFSSRAPPNWHANFAAHAAAYRHAQLNALQPPPPHQGEYTEEARQQTLTDTFISQRRHTSGAYLLFDLIQLALGHRIPVSSELNLSNPPGVELKILSQVDIMKSLAADIVALSSDLVSYNSFQSTTAPHQHKLPHNAISLCMHAKHLSAQGATNQIARLVKQKIQDFLEAEQTLQSFHPSRYPPVDDFRSSGDRSPALYSWIKLPIQTLSGLLSSSPSTPTTTTSCQSDDSDEYHVKLFLDAADTVQVLRDYIAGAVHWFYETELYFGTKGEEVKAFGWVFLNAPSLPLVTG